MAEERFQVGHLQIDISAILLCVCVSHAPPYVPMTYVFVKGEQKITVFAHLLPSKEERTTSGTG